jgi:hypothetical protein
MALTLSSLFCNLNIMVLYALCRVCSFWLHRESPDMILGGERLLPQGWFCHSCYRLQILSSLVPIHGISHSKMGSYLAVIPPSKVMMLFRHVPQA